MLNRIRKMREKKGFTLVELIVVIAIIAILTAVIVPLVGRYAAQATYSTLQEAAKTVSNSSATAIADATMMGTVIPDATFTGTKASGTLTLTGAPTNGDFDDKLIAALQEALPNGAAFQVEISGNTVAGVRYSTTLSESDLTDAAATIAANTDFTEAYDITVNGGTSPVGLAGNQIP